MVTEKQDRTHRENRAETQPSRSVPSQHSWVGQGMVIEGKVAGKGDLVVHGTVKGEINLKGCQVSIDDGASVEAEMRAEAVTVRGKFKGNLVATGLVNLQPTSQFEGVLKAARLQMEDGAKLKGTIDLNGG
ncbi:MAG: polymer-forming cytoskeletal protein [Nitrospinota bacterium]